MAGSVASYAWSWSGRLGVEMGFGLSVASPCHEKRCWWGAESQRALCSVASYPRGVVAAR